MGHLEIGAGEINLPGFSLSCVKESHGKFKASMFITEMLVQGHAEVAK